MANIFTGPHTNNQVSIARGQPGRETGAVLC